MDKNEKPLKLTEFAEKKLITYILKGIFPKESKLPNERELAKEIGVTRATLRETLQRLSKDGWITIRHGRSTVVNDYWDKGGLGILATLTKYIEFLPEDFFKHIIEARNFLIPEIAMLSVKNNPKAIIKYLKKSENLKDNPEAFVKYDWNLYILMAKCSQNLIFPLILNSFKSIYTMATINYFNSKKSRELAKKYYQELINTINLGAYEVKKMVYESMIKSSKINDKNQFKKCLKLFSF